MTRRSASRGILYTAPPLDDPAGEESTADQSGSAEEGEAVRTAADTSEPSAADD